MFPIIIPIQSYPQYIKKAELEAFIQKRAKTFRMIVVFEVIAFIIVQIIISLLVMPKMFSLYDTLNQTPPVYQPYIMIASIIVGLAVIIIASLINPLDAREVEKLRQDKEDLITINRPFANKTIMWLILGYPVIFFAAMVFSVILPIYGLTSSVYTQ